MVSLALVCFLITGKFGVHVAADQIFYSAASEKPGEHHYTGKTNQEGRISSTEETGRSPAATGV